MYDVADLALETLCGLLRDRTLSPRELIEVYLERIGSTDAVLNAYIEVTGDQARRQATASERRHQAGTPLGPLDGVPIALKDLIDVAGVATSNGMSVRRNAIADADAEVVRRLSAAGAVLLGKLNMHEAALGTTNDNSHFGRCCNPWAADHTPGGSSGGSGAAVAGGLAAGALGSDNMGSIRIPASFCGVAGLKPSNHLVSTRGVVELSETTGAVGPMARGVDGIAMMMSVLADAGPMHPQDLDFALPDEPSLAGLRVGLPEPFGLEPQADVADAFQRTLTVIADCGAEIRPIDIPELPRSRMSCLLIIEAEAAVAYRAYMDNPAVEFAADIRQMLDYGRALSSSKLGDAFLTRERLQQRMEPVFRDVDVLVTPTTPCAAHGFDEPAPAEGSAYMALANLCALPALTVPMGLTPAGLPLGLQIMAAPFQDPLTLRVGKAYEQRTNWHEQRPRRWFSAE